PVGSQRHDLVLVTGTPEPEVLCQLLVDQTEGLGKWLMRKDVQVAVLGVGTRQVRSALPPTVGDKDRAVPTSVGGGRCGQRRRGRVRHVVRNIGDLFRVQAGKCGGQEVWCTLDVDRAQLFPDGVQAGTVLQGERGVVGVGDHVKV